MSIAFKKIKSMVIDVIENDSRFEDLDKKALEKLCIDIYTVESGLDSGFSSSAVKDDIKGKISTRFAKILKVSE